MTLRRVALLLLAGAALPAARLAAQPPLSAHVDGLLTGAYRWRAIPRASGLNAQLETVLRLSVRRYALSAGAWTNVELGTHRSGTLTDLVPGHWGPSEYDVWGELARSGTRADLALGLVRYQYRGRLGTQHTHEIYSRLRGSGHGTAGISPELSLWYDLSRRHAGYLEAGATAPFLALPLRGIGFMPYAGIRAGAAIGRPDHRAEFASTTFAGTGLTAADLSAGFRVNGEKSLGGVLLNMAGHLQYGRDAATRRSRLTPARLGPRWHPYFTFGLGFRWPPPPDR